MSISERTPGRRGRVLRVKVGYNPNSSSVGSQVPSFLAFALGSGAATVLLLNTLNAVGRLIRRRKQRLVEHGEQTKK